MLPAPPLVPRLHPLPWSAAILAGLPLVALGLVLLTGSPESAAGLFVISVVCTAGVGLAFWGGLALVVGLTFLYILDQLLRGLGRPGGSGLFQRAGTAVQLEHRQRVLERYLARCLAQGVDPVRVRQDLLQAGWSERQLQTAFQTLRRN